MSARVTASEFPMRLGQNGMAFFICRQDEIG